VNESKSSLKVLYVMTMIINIVFREKSTIMDIERERMCVGQQGL